MEKHSKFYVCSYKDCSAKFYRPDRLLCHSRVHSGDRPFMCSYDDCMKSYTRASTLKRHEAAHEQSNVKCPFENCDVILKSEVTLKKHIDNVHNNTKRKIYKCPRCDEEFNKHSRLRIHEYRHTKVKPYVCSKLGCEKSFLTPSRLRRHMKVHDGHKCNQVGCNKICKNWSLMRKHVKVAHPKVHRCNICEKTFLTSWNLNLHTKIHIIDRPVVTCPILNCPRFYTEQRNLNHHLKNYHEKRPFHCVFDGCHLAFKEKDQLAKHERDHDPNVPLSSKKRKKKSKTTTKSPPTLAAILAGYTESEKPVRRPTVKVAESIEESVTASSDISDEKHYKIIKRKRCSIEKPIPEIFISDESEDSFHGDIKSSFNPEKGKILDTCDEFITQIDKKNLNAGESDEYMVIEVLVSVDQSESLSTDVSENFSKCNIENESFLVTETKDTISKIFETENNYYQGRMEKTISLNKSDNTCRILGSDDSLDFEMKTNDERPHTNTRLNNIPSHVKIKVSHELQIHTK